MYEGTIAYTTMDGKGNDKVVKTQYVLEQCEGFGEAETRLYDHCNELGLRDAEVVALKRSAVREVANRRTMPDERIWLCEVEDTFKTDDGDEKVMRYKLLGYALDFNAARAMFTAFLAQGYSMNIVTIKKTRLEEVLR